MTFTRWLAAIGLLTGLGLLKVGQQNALLLKSYALGERVQKTHEQETELAWLNARVMSLTSPNNLSKTAEDRHMKLVAWATLNTQQLEKSAGASSPVSNEPLQVADGRDTTD